MVLGQKREKVNEVKKVYSKPQVIIESFVVSDFVAGNCVLDVGFGDTGASKSCSIDAPGFPGERLFNDYTTCTLLWDDGEDKGCYDIPDGGVGYFGS